MSSSVCPCSCTLLELHVGSPRQQHTGAISAHVMALTHKPSFGRSVSQKCYQNTLSYASSKVNYSVWESIYMLPSDMTLKIRPGTVGYINKILVSDAKFSLGKNDEVNAGLAKSEEETTTKQTTTMHKVKMKALQLPAPAEKAVITHEDEMVHVSMNRKDLMQLML